MSRGCGPWISLGSEPGQGDLFDVCFCRTLVECLDCGEPHKFVACCTACANAGRGGVSWDELQERAG